MIEAALDVAIKTIVGGIFVGLAFAWLFDLIDRRGAR